VIVGGGPAGTSAAIALAMGGGRPLLIERQREVGDALCGGFLSWRTLEALGRLGVEADALGPAIVTQVRLFAGKRVRAAPLPRPARGVSRHRLDTLLIARAEAAGAEVRRGVAVRAIEEGGARTDDGATLGGPLLLATGKHDLRGAARPADARGQDPALGLRIRLGGGARRLVDDAVELHLFDRGYAGTVVQEDGSVNLCMAVRRSRLTEAGDPERLMAALAAECPALGERLAWRDGAPIDAVANVPYGWRARTGVAGLYRLGDQAGVIPSLAGEGIGIALASGVAAGKALLAGEDARAWQPRFARRLARPLAVAGTVRSLAERPATARLAAALPSPMIQVVAAATRIRHDLICPPPEPRSRRMDQLNLSEAEWRARLSPEQYHVLREAGTERAWSGRYNDNKADGIYHCAACGLSLFDSADKYDSGSGWPSFTQPITPDAVTDHRDTSHGMTRVETRCARCDSHLGHVFPDGPPPTGLRYCMNSVSLDFRPRAAG
jgi:methionine-R-sulfoxide reductase